MPDDPGTHVGLRTYDSKAERREVRRATRHLSRSQGGTGETEGLAREVMRSLTHRDADLRMQPGLRQVMSLA